jgi:N utilization substance protein B
MSEVSLPPSDDSDWNREFDPRSDARERALNILFEADLRTVAPGEVVERMQVAIDDLTSILVVGVAEHRTRIDELITAHSHAWSIDRMATTDRNVLRMSTFELLGRSEVPTAVIINEAVELAKRYGTDDSGRFVNGMLSAIARTTREGGAPTPPPATQPSSSPAPQPVTPPAAD